MSFDTSDWPLMFGSLHSIIIVVNRDVYFASYCQYLIRIYAHLFQPLNNMYFVVKLNCVAFAHLCGTSVRSIRSFRHNNSNVDITVI